MEQQLVDKITHLEAQLKQLDKLELGIRSTFNLKSFYNRKINDYSLQ